MQITIDTNHLSDKDVEVLALLAGSDPAPSQWASEPEAKTPAAAPAPAKRFTAKDFEAVDGVGEVTAQRIVAALYGDASETPQEDEEPEAEASAPEEAPAAEEASESAGDGPTMSDAVAAATQLVSSGKAAQVKAALAEVGAKRVSEMDEGDIPAFMAALEA